MRISPTQERILKALSDGMPHHRDELHKCLNDEFAEITAIEYHISTIRKVLRPLGQDIICEYANRKRFYRHIRLLASANDGRS